MLAVGGAFQATLNWLQPRGADNAGLLMVLAMAFALACFFLNTLLVTAVVKRKRREWWTASDLFAVFGWVRIAYAGSAIAGGAVVPGLPAVRPGRADGNGTADGHAALLLPPTGSG